MCVSLRRNILPLFYHHNHHHPYSLPLLQYLFHCRCTYHTYCFVDLIVPYIWKENVVSHLSFWTASSLFWQWLIQNKDSLLTDLFFLLTTLSTASLFFTFGILKGRNWNGFDTFHFIWGKKIEDWKLKDGQRVMGIYGFPCSFVFCKAFLQN